MPLFGIHYFFTKTIKYRGVKLILGQGAQTAQFDLKWVRPEACAMKQDLGLST